MSGGSYNYLCYKEADELINEEYELESIADRLLELKCETAAKETYELIYDIKKFKMLLEIRKKRLDGMWKSIEWFDSNDTGLETVMKDYAEFNKCD